MIFESIRFLNEKDDDSNQMMEDHIYQYIFNEIYTYLPKEWDKLVIYLEYGGGSYLSLFSFYVKINGKYIACNNLENASESDLVSSYRNIDKILSKEREKITDKNLWTNMTMVVEPSGNIKAYFDYAYITYKYKEEWKEKYLKL